MLMTSAGADAVELRLDMSERSTCEPPLLDRRPVAELIEVLGAPSVREVIAKFTADTTARLVALDAAAGARRFTEIDNHLHTLKTTSATLGLVRLSDLARAIETSVARSGGHAAWHDALRPVFQASIAALAAAFPELA